MKVIGMIPVRMESTRLPEKAMRKICGLPMIVHTLLRSQFARTLEDVYVVTDSVKISNLVQSYGGKVLMTGSHHQTGSDRLAEAAMKIDADVIVNIQGDEALVDPLHIDLCAEGLLNSDHKVAILLTPYNKNDRPSDIKAVVNKKNEIMYLSRADIPSASRTKSPKMLKAYHVVSFEKLYLIEYSKLEKTELENIEFNEYLRVLEHGHKIQGVMVQSDAVSVDTKDDLDFVTSEMLNDSLFQRYKHLVK